MVPTRLKFRNSWMSTVPETLSVVQEIVLVEPDDQFSMPFGEATVTEADGAGTVPTPSMN